ARAGAETSARFRPRGPHPPPDRRPVRTAPADAAGRRAGRRGSGFRVGTVRGPAGDDPGTVPEDGATTGRLPRGAARGGRRPGDGGKACERGPRDRPAGGGVGGLHLRGRGGLARRGARLRLPGPAGGGGGRRQIATALREGTVQPDLPRQVSVRGCERAP